MPELEPLPPGVPSEMQARLCMTADLLPDGSYGRQWLVVEGDTVRVFAPSGNGAAKERLSLPLRALESPKAESVVGGGVLEVTHEGQTIELVRYTNARSAPFAFAARALEKWAKGEEPEEPQDEPKHCPRCGLPLDAGTKVCPACLPRSRTVRRLVVYLLPHWRQAMGLSALALAGTALGLVPPYLNMPLMDRVLAPSSHLPFSRRMHLLAILVLALLLARVLGTAISVGQSWLSAQLGNLITHDIRCQIYQHLHRLPMRFFDKQQMGTVISRVNQDTGQLQGFLVWGAQDLTTNLLMIVGIGAALFVMNWKLAILVFLPAPVVAILSTVFVRLMRRFMQRFFNRWGRLNSILNESLTGLRIARVFAQEGREITRFRQHSSELATIGTQAERSWSLLFSSLSLLIMSGTMLVWYVGGRDVLFKEMSLGTLVAFIQYVGMFYGPIQAMSWLLNWSSRSLTAAERVFEILDSEPEVSDAEDRIAMPQIEGRIEFSHVTFGYDKHKPALKDVCLEIVPGEMIGLVGHSGAGKTTAINLVCRFYAPDEGEVRVDGISLSRIRLEDLRRQIGIVPQDTFLFDGTIAQNIAYAQPAASREEIIRAAKVANAHDFILRKPDGYETMVGEGGKGLSGGERQRVAIARAVLHNPRILILDEATSHVDVETEAQIQEAIQRLVKGRTTIAIAHRLSTLKNADRLVVLKEGKVAEMGTHDELLAKEDGEFRQLVNKYQEVSRVQAVAR